MERCLACEAAGVRVLERCLACEADFERVAPSEHDWQRVGVACSSYPSRAGTDGTYGTHETYGTLRPITAAL